MRAMTLGNRLGLVLLTILSVGLISGFTLAAKPGGDGGPAPPGEIFFDWGSEFGGGSDGPFYESRGFWSMNSDGTGKQLRYRPEDIYDLSHWQHQGHRWFLATGPASGRGAMYAVRDDGDPDSAVLLLAGGDLPGDRYIENKRWAKDDSFIAFSVIDAANNVGEIWGVQVAFDEMTGVPGLVSTPVLIVEEPQANLFAFDVSPLGDQVVYQLNTDGASLAPLLVKDLVTGESRLLPALGADPLWSPDGSRIAFAVVNAGIHVINPDGSGLVQLSSVIWGDYMGDWSPDGEHVVFTRLLRKSRGGLSVYSADVLRVTVASGDTVNLTKDIDGTAWAAFWR